MGEAEQLKVRVRFSPDSLAPPAAVSISAISVCARGASFHSAGPSGRLCYVKIFVCVCFESTFNVWLQHKYNHELQTWSRWQLLGSALVLSESQTLCVYLHLINEHHLLCKKIKIPEQTGTKQRRKHTQKSKENVEKLQKDE